MVHHEKTGGNNHASTFEWKIGEDGGIRSHIDPRYCLSVPQNRVGNGYKLIMWHCGMSEKHSKLENGQTWMVEGNFIKLKNNPSHCLSIREGKQGDGSDVILWECGYSNAFRFSVEGNAIKYKQDPK